MTSYGQLYENGSFPVSRKASVVVEVKELDATSPPVEAPTNALPDRFFYVSADAYSGKANTSAPVNMWQTKVQTSFLQSTAPRPWSMCEAETASDERVHRAKKSRSLSPKKSGFVLRLPSFEDMKVQKKQDFDWAGRAGGIMCQRYEARSLNTTGRDEPGSLSELRLSQESSTLATFGSTPLLTPPDEKEFCITSPFGFNNTTSTSSSDYASVPSSNSPAFTSLSSADQESSQTTTNSSQESSGRVSRDRRISIPPYDTVDHSQAGADGWLERAVGRAVSAIHGSSLSLNHAQVIAQLVPVRPHRTMASPKPVFESVLEAIQKRAADPLFPINITHAVPQMVAMEDVPTSPPATPHLAHGGNDYFDVQTIFSQAAPVISYHAVHTRPPPAQGRNANLIISPRSVDVSVLERYIPPTSASEHADFFSNGGKSYLIDRLSELKQNDGTLILIYPTRRGAETFLSRYLNPVLEPLIRAFIYYHGLYHYLGERLSAMEAMGSMRDFEELRTHITRLCAAISGRTLARNGPASTFNLVHSEVGEVTLSRSDWVEGYIHQEQPRLRADLVQYQREGGRMPPAVGQHEATPATLTRELIDGLRKSSEPAGGVGIEVGVFVIARSA